MTFIDFSFDQLFLKLKYILLKENLPTSQFLKILVMQNKKE